MGTYDIRGGTPRHDPMFNQEPAIDPVAEKVLELIDGYVPTEVCDQIVKLIEDAKIEEAADADYARSVPRD